MLAIAPGWELSVERGPGCLLVKLGDPEHDVAGAPPLADVLRSLMEQYLVSRLVLDLSEVKYFDRHLLAHLVRLNRRVHDHGGLVRLTGLSKANQALVRIHGLTGHLPVYDDVEDAVMGAYPGKPR